MNAHIKTLLTASTFAVASANAATVLVNEGFETPYIAPSQVASGAYGSAFYRGSGNVIWSRNSNNSTDVPGTWVNGASDASNNVIQQEWNGANDYFGFTIPTHTWTAGLTYTLTMNVAAMTWNGTLQRYIRPQLREQDGTVLWAPAADASTTVPTIASGNPYGRTAWTSGNTFSWTIDASTFSGAGVTPGSLLDLRIGSSGQRGLYIDNIMLTVVPEPASFALVGLGGLLLGMHRRR
jgi:PEP-CTERM motif